MKKTIGMICFGVLGVYGCHESASETKEVKVTSASETVVKSVDISFSSADLELTALTRICYMATALGGGSYESCFPRCIGEINRGSESKLYTKTGYGLESENLVQLDPGVTVQSCGVELNFEKATELAKSLDKQSLADFTLKERNRSYSPVCSIVKDGEKTFLRILALTGKYDQFWDRVTYLSPSKHDIPETAVKIIVDGSDIKKYFRMNASDPEHFYVEKGDQKTRKFTDIPFSIHIDYQAKLPVGNDAIPGLTIIKKQPTN